MRTTASLLLLTAAFFVGQEPQRQDPKPAEQQPKAEEAAEPKADESKQGESKAAAGRPPRHRFEGVYRLRERVVDGVSVLRDNRGYLAITQRHLLLSLAAPGPDDDHPLVHASVREWQETRDGVRTVMKLDYNSDSEGGIELQPYDTVEDRRLELRQGGIRVWQGTRSWLDFERVE